MLIRLLLTGVALATANVAVAVAEPRDLATCLVKRDARAAARFAASQPGSAEEATALRALGGCDATGALGDPAQRMLVAGTVAERLLARANRNIYGQRYVAVEAALLDARGFSDQALQRFAAMPPRDAVVACAASRDPDGASAVLRSKPASDKEAQAMQRLAPAIERCVVQGKRFAFERPAMRAMIARTVFSEGFTRFTD